MQYFTHLKLLVKKMKNCINIKKYMRNLNFHIFSATLFNSVFIERITMEKVLLLLICNYSVAIILLLLKLNNSIKAVFNHVEYVKNTLALVIVFWLSHRITKPSF